MTTDDAAGDEQVSTGAHLLDEIYDFLEEKLAGRPCSDYVMVRAVLRWLGERAAENAAQHDPWAEVLRRGDVEVEFVDLEPGDAHAYTTRWQGFRYVVQLDADPRGPGWRTDCLAHELGHIELGLFHAAGEPLDEPVMEERVDRYAARRFQREALERPKRTVRPGAAEVVTGMCAIADSLRCVASELGTGPIGPVSEPTSESTSDVLARVWDNMTRFDEVMHRSGRLTPEQVQAWRFSERRRDAIARGVIDVPENGRAEVVSLRRKV